jgi:flagellar basal body-associated protein FliL
MKNKKANIPVMILVFLTIVTCVVALIAFHIDRKSDEKQVNAFKYLRVIYNAQDNMAYAGKSLGFVKELYKQSKTRSYYPVVKQIEEKDNYLVFKKTEKKWYQWQADEQERNGKLLLEIKVPIEE